MSTHGSSPDVAIIGGGIVGCALAYDLARQGVAVTLYERREIGREASWASAGIISPPGPRHGTRAELSLLAFRRYPALIAEVQEASGMAVGYVPGGEIDLGTDETATTLRETLEWQRAHGMASEWLDEQQLRQREPAVHESFTCGLANIEAGSVVLARMTQALARAAAQHGATIHEHTSVQDILIERGRATALRTFDGEQPVGAVVIAAGAWSRSLGATIDVSIPTLPVRGQMLAIADPPIPIRSVLAGAGGYLVPRADGTVAVGATEEHDAGFDARVTTAGLAELHQLVERIAPSLAQGRFVEAWAGLRPGTEDGELIVGRAPHLDNLWISTGHFRSGALLAPATAQLLADSIVSGQVDGRLAAFDPARSA
jgi:glycine oxidase